MKKIRWGLLSTARINRRLIPAIRASERGKLVGVASRSEATAVSYAKSWNIPQTYGSYEAMLASDQIDAVYISLPNHLHAPWSIKAMRAGKHVLCEKPFALSLEDVDRVTAVSQQTGMVIAEAFMYRHHPQTKIVGEWVRNQSSASGRLGKINLVRSVFNFKLANLENVRMVPEWGGGSLWDVGCYPVSFAQYVMGESPERVIGNQVVGSTGVDESFAGQLYYSGGRMAQIACSFRTPYHCHAEILGSNGRLEITRPFTSLDSPDQRLTFYPETGDPIEIPVPKIELYLGEVQDMHAAILDGKPNYLTLAETRNHVQTLLRLYSAAAQNQIISL